MVRRPLRSQMTARFGATLERPFHQARRYADAVAVIHLETLPPQQRHRLRFVQTDAGAIQDFEAGVVQPFGLVVRQLAETGGVVGRIIAL